MTYSIGAVTTGQLNARGAKMKPTCDRCGVTDPQGAHIMSKFNTEWICIPCKKLEEAHPMYEMADKAERTQIRLGNYNYEGIGLPDDLR